MRVGGFQSHVNLIAYNPIEEEEFKRLDQSRIEVFRRALERRGVAVSLRSSRGLDQDRGFVFCSIAFSLSRK